ncbi:hypothetical protein BAY59_10625 [Prauserella coralliicola]|nr:hypothetical protein BAY59_10625 [Prauserella coralliicola]
MKFLVMSNDFGAALMANVNDSARPPVLGESSVEHAVTTDPAVTTAKTSTPALALVFARIFITRCPSLDNPLDRRTSQV